MSEPDTPADDDSIDKPRVKILVFERTSTGLAVVLELDGEFYTLEGELALVLPQRGDKIANQLTNDHCAELVGLQLRHHDTPFANLEQTCRMFLMEMLAEGKYGNAMPASLAMMEIRRHMEQHFGCPLNGKLRYQWLRAFSAAWETLKAELMPESELAPPH